MRDGRSAFWATVFRFDPARIAPSVGMRNAVGVALPIATGMAFHATGSGLLAATGALNVAFSDSRLPYIQRARRMLTASAVVAFGVFVGTLCGHNQALTLAVVTGWAFAAGMLVALDQTAADVGTVSLVTVLVFAVLPMPPDRQRSRAYWLEVAACFRPRSRWRCGRSAPTVHSAARLPTCSARWPTPLPAP